MSPTHVRQEIEIEKDIEIDKEIDKEIEGEIEKIQYFWYNYRN